MLDLQEVKELAQEIYDDLEEYEFYNEGPVDDNGDIIGGDFATFQDMKIPSMASGNCLNVSEIVYDKYADIVDYDEEFGTQGNHCFNLVGDYVIDFTYRQFDPTCEFPLVQKKDEYMKNLMRHLNG